VAEAGDFVVLGGAPGGPLPELCDFLTRDLAALDVTAAETVLVGEAVKRPGNPTSALVETLTIFGRDQRSLTLQRRLVLQRQIVILRRGGRGCDTATAR
jgi:hypothetical protein